VGAARRPESTEPTEDMLKREGIVVASAQDMRESFDHCDCGRPDCIATERRAEEAIERRRCFLSAEGK
jgi:hypothetical protein